MSEKAEQAGGSGGSFAVVVLLNDDGGGTGCWRKKAEDYPAWIAGEEARKGVEVCV